MIDEKVRVLIETGAIDQEQLQFGLEEQLRTNKPIVDILIEKGFITEAKLKETLDWYELKDLDIYKLDVAPDVLNMLPIHIIKKHRVFPLKFEKNKFVLGMLDPNDLIIKDTISIFLGRNVAIQGYKIEEKDYEFFINKYGHILGETKEKEYEEIREALKKDKIDPSATIDKFVSSTLENAIKTKASLITIEPSEDEVRVRFRIDNVFYEETRFPRKMYQNFLSYIKEISGLEGEEKSFHYAGHFKFTTSNRQEINFVINGVKTITGDKLILRPGYKIPDLKQLFYCPEPYDYITGITNKNKGVILVIGGAGSGKTTTLYSILQNKISNRYQLMTIEDPVEYVFENYVSQIQIKSDRVQDVSNLIYEIARHNPDVLMVHDIKDKTWSVLLEELALSGILVLAGMRAYNTLSALKRLKRIESPNFSSIQCVINQKLVRKLCYYCRTKYNTSATELNTIGFDVGKITELFVADPKGCSKCLGGYKGLIGVFEVIKISRELINMLNENTYLGDDVGKAINSACVITFKEYGSRLLRDGIITLEEYAKIS